MRRFVLLLSFLGLLLIIVPAASQQNLPTLPQPRLQTVFPAGGKVGTTIEVTFAGTDLEEPDTLLFSHPGLKAEAIVPPAPPEPKTPDPKAPAPKKGRGAGPRVVTKFKVSISPGTPLGLHDVRLVNKWGVSNPRAFAVSDQNEVEEKEPNNDVAQAQRVPINTVVNGVINSPTDVDYYSFNGRQGQRLLLHVAGSSIDSKVRPAIELYELTGQRLIFNRNYHGSDALADVTLPHDGDYFVRLYEFTHTAGSQDYYYRLSITTAPWIDAIVPPMVEPGKPTQVTIYGRNLPGGQPDPTAIVDGATLEKLSATITAPAEPLARQRLAFSGRIDPASSALDGFEYRLQGPAGSSNPYLMQFARAPVVFEKEPNDKAEAAQAVPVPCEIAGRLDKRDDRDWYALSVKKGDLFTLELFGDRLGAPADFYFIVKPADPKAGSLGEFDDNQDLLHPFQFYTRTSDPLGYRLEAKSDGNFLVMVSSRDAGTEFGPRHLYRLRITREQPDFRLIVMPGTNHRSEGTVVPADGQQLFDVFVWKHDGFAAPITLSAEGLPAGVTCPPQTIGAGLKQATLVLSAAANAAPTVSAFTVKGTAMVNGQTLVREARPATITWGTPPGQNTPTISRVDRQLVVAIRDKAPFRVAAKVESLTVKQGDKTTLNFTVTRLWPDFKGQVAVQTMTVVNNQPLIPGVTFNNNQPLNVAPDKTEGSGPLVISVNAVPGVYSLVLRGTAAHQFEKMPKGPKVNSGLSQPSLPVTLTIVPASLGTLQASVAGNAKVGGSTELTVKVTRQQNFAGEYKLQLVLPMGVKGIKAENAVIPAGMNEAKIKLQVDGDVKPGNIANLVVQATALFEGKTPITSEAKFNLTVVK